jgi:hypothetical protein
MLTSWQKTGQRSSVTWFNGHKLEIQSYPEGWRLTIDDVLDEQIYPTEDRIKGAVESAAQECAIRSAYKEIKSILNRT